MRPQPLRHPEGKPADDALVIYEAQLDLARHLQEQLHAKNRELAENVSRKDRFLAQLAHELRNPLSAASNAVYMIRMAHEDTGRQTRGLEILERQIEQMRRLIDQIMDMSRMRISMQESALESLDLGSLCRDAAEDVSRGMELAGLSFQVKLPEEAVPIEGDAVRLRQVIHNLLQNAVKFSDPGGVVSLQVVSKPDEFTVELSVSDTGIGMATEELDQVFHPFHQNAAAILRNRGGLGLGLALVQEIITGHGGTVRAASDGHGQGSTFTVQFRLAPPEGAWFPREDSSNRESNTGLEETHDG